MSLDQTKVKCKQCQQLCPCAAHGYGFADWNTSQAVIQPAAGRRFAVHAQTAPTGEGAVVLDSVIAKIDAILGLIKPDPMHPYAHAFNPAGLPPLKQDLITRAEMGQSKYGTKLRINNGRRAIVDLYQELMDALMYSQQARMEGDHLPGAFVELLINLAAQVAAELDRR